MFGACWLKTPGAVAAVCLTCRGSYRLELEELTIWTSLLCLAAWLMALASGSRFAVRVARSAGAACFGMGLVAWGFVWGWW
jgi:hypothetical protein